MASTAVTRKRSVSNRGKSRGRSRLRWYDAWPLLLAIAATPFAVRTAEILPLMGLAGMHRLCLLLPFPLLAQRLLHVSDSVSQSMMYLQFPAYALLLMIVQAWKTLAAAIIAILLVHLIAAAAAWILISGILR